MEESDKKTNLKKNIIIISIAIIVIILISFICVIMYNKKIESELEKCYLSINDNYDYEEFKKIISQNSSKAFKQKAYNELNKALDNHNYILRDETVDNNTRFKILKLLSTIEKDNSTPAEEVLIVKSKTNYCDYYYFMSYGKSQEEKNIIDAYRAYLVALGKAEAENDENAYANAKLKVDEFEKNAIIQFKNDLNKYLQEQDYSKGYSYVLKYSEIIEYTSDEEVKSNYNLIKNKYEETKKIQNEKDEQEENAKIEAEINAKKDQKIVDTNGKVIYKVYMKDNIFKLKGTFSGQGHFSVQLLDSNQDLYKLMVNEIGDYVIDKSVAVSKGSYYYIQIETTRGTWDLEWTGTYGN